VRPRISTQALAKLARHLAGQPDANEDGVADAEQDDGDADGILDEIEDEVRIALSSVQKKSYRTCQCIRHTVAERCGNAAM
jgi:hypothetical protein